MDAIYDWKLSKMQHSADRYSLVLQLIGAVLYLTCIIFKPMGAHGPPFAAFETFEKAVSIWDEFKPTFRMACHGRKPTPEDRQRSYDTNCESTISGGPIVLKLAADTRKSDQELEWIHADWPSLQCC